MKVIFKLGVLGLLWLGGLSAQAQETVKPVMDTTRKASESYSYYFAKGLKSKTLGNKDEAIACFQKCLDLSQTSGSAFYELGLLYAEKKDYSAATGYARNAWKRDPSNKWYGLLLIENLMAQGKPADCIPIYRDLQKIEPETDEFRIGEIEMLIQAKQEKEAVKKINHLPDDKELTRWGIVKKKEIYFSLNQFDKGANELIGWLKKHQDDYEIRGILAEAYAANGKKELAASQYKILKDQNPDNPAVSFSLGQFLYQSGNKSEALTEFLNGFKSPDVNPSIKIEVIKSFISGQEQKSKLDPGVIKLIDVLYQVDKGNSQVDALYANYLYSEDKLEEAKPIYRSIIQKDPGNFLAWQNLLFIMNQQLDYKGMQEVSDSALVYYPSQGLFYLFKGIAEIEFKNYPNAITALNKGLSVPSQNAELVKQFYLSLAEALFRNGNVEEAFKNYDQMLVLEPNNAQVLNNYSYYLSINNQNLDKALEMITKCVDSEKDNATYLDTYAWVLFKRDEFAKALIPMQKAIDLSKDPSSEVLEHYGDILYKNGKVDEARNAWIQANSKKDASDKIADKIKNGLK